MLLVVYKLRATAQATDVLTRSGRQAGRWIERVPLLPVLVVELIAVDLYQLPEALNFPCFAFGDCGANFTAQYLVAHGARPGLDFGYHYGLFSLFFGRLCFSIFGWTPHAYVAANFLLNLAAVWALARFARALNLRAEGKLLIVAGLGYATYFQPYPDFAHMLEATLIIWALAEQARGARLNAVGLAAVAALAKPAMGYFYAPLLIGFSAFDQWGADSAPLRREWARVLCRGALIWTAAAALLAAAYGPRALIHTVLPLAGARAYRRLHFGFFARGGFRDFLPQTHGWLWNGAAFWTLAGLYLLGYGARSLWSLRTRPDAESSRAAEVTGSCAVLHLSFILIFFARAWSCFYYSYLLIIGAAASSERSASARAGALLLCLLAVLGYTTNVRWTLHDWVRKAPSAETAGLWASPGLRAEWSRVLQLSHGRRTAVLARLGAAAIMYPQFEPPVSWVLVPGLATTREVRLVAEQISRARLVVLTNLYSWPDDVPPFAQLREALEPFQPIFIGRFFRVLALPVRAGSRPIPRATTAALDLPGPRFDGIRAAAHPRVRRTVASRFLAGGHPSSHAERAPCLIRRLRAP